VRLCRSCLRRFGDLRNNTPLDLLELVSCGFCILLLISATLSSVRLCRSCLRRFGDLRKNTPLDFWSMYLMDLVNFHRFEGASWTNNQQNMN